MGKLAVAALLAILAIGALLAQPLVREGFWCDEAFTIEIARDASPAAFFHDLRAGDPHPPLFHALLALWGRIVDWRELPIKLFALFWGLLAIAGIGAAGWRLGNPMGGVLAAAIALHSPLITAHMAETRSYAMSVAFLTLGIAARRSKLAVVLLACACWTHYVALFAIGTCGALALLARAWDVAKVNLIAAATTLPLLPLVLAQSRTGLPYEAKRSAAERTTLALQKIAFALPHGNFAPALAGAVVLVAIAVTPLFFLPATVASLRRYGARFALLAAYALPVLVVFGFVGSAERYITIGAALLCVMAALLVLAVDEAAPGKARLAFRTLAGLYLVLSLGSVIVQAPQIVAQRWDKSGARALARAARFTSSDVLLVAPEVLAPTLDYYAGQKPLIVGFAQWDRPQVLDMPRQRALWSDPNEAARAAARLAQLVAAKHPARVFYVSGRIGTGLPLIDDPRIRRLTGELSKRWTLVPAGTYAGRVETLYVWMLR